MQSKARHGSICSVVENLEMKKQPLLGLRHYDGRTSGNQSMSEHRKDCALVRSTWGCWTVVTPNKSTHIDQPVPLSSILKTAGVELAHIGPSVRTYLQELEDLPAGLSAV